MTTEILKNVVHPEEIKLYKRRWILMAVFIFYTVSCGLHWVQFGSISNIVTRYYGVSETLVEWTTIPFMLAYVIFVFPSLYIIDKIGVKNGLLLVGFGTATGAIIKIFSVSPNRFWVLMIGQMFEAVFTVFTFGLVGRFTALWFGSKEISRAGALTLLGDQFGSALSFLLPSLMVEDSSNVEVVENGMMRMHITFATISIMTLLLIAFLFKDKPKKPPSFAQVKQSDEKQNVWKSIAIIFTKRSFLLMSFSYGFAVAVSSAYSTMLNQLIERNFKEYTQDAGKIGFVFMVSGMISSYVLGHILDKTRQFKMNAVALSFGALISMTFLSVALKLGSIVLVYVATSLIGAFLLGYYATGMQLGIEVTYPISESIVMSSMSLFVQLISLGLTSAYGFALKEFGDVVSNIGMICILMTSVVLACLIPPNLKREKVEKLGAAQELKEFIPKS